MSLYPSLYIAFYVSLLLLLLYLFAHEENTFDVLFRSVSHEIAETENSAVDHGSRGNVNIANTNSARNNRQTLHEAPNDEDGYEEGPHRGLDEVEGIQQQTD